MLRAVCSGYKYLLCVVSEGNGKENLQSMIIQLTQTLKFTLNPPTLSGWANRFMLQWDAFLEQNTYAQKHPIFATCEHKYFKKCDNDSYRRFRTMMQLLDCATL